MIDNPTIAHDFYDLLNDTKVQELSEKGFSFGILGHKYDMLEREIKSIVTDILQNQKLSYLIGATGALASCIGNTTVGVFTSSLGMITHRLRNVDLKEYAPPIRKETIFILPRSVRSSSNKIFNNEYKVYLPKK